VSGRLKGGPKTGGRKRGTPNKRTVERERAVAAAARKITAALGADAFPGDAHALLMAVYKDPQQPAELRIEAARAAIGYEKPRLAAVEAKVDGRMTLEQLILSSLRHDASRQPDKS
jgi:hypothetical protein